ncbi:MAG: serine/threonine-protein kinase [Myxococcaceae bacterium]|nr:serine/threonine-protein kinase [Myxococcaceae bacterium]
MASRFGKYELVRSLGHGGMAEAWLANARGAAGVTRPVVIKKVLPELSANGELIEGFISEAKISATLSHGNIAQVFEFGEYDGEYFLAMEWVNGKSLAHVIKRADQKGYWHLPIPIAVFIAAEMLKGLHHAHTRKGADGRPMHLVHRDVTPDNVLLSFEGEVKVADFGIAKARLTGRKETQVGVVKGKFLYFSPEQATGKQVDARTDVYAVGACLYQMLTGQLPFEGPFMQVMPKLVAGEKRPLRELNPDVPDALEDIVDRAMAKDLQTRYRSAQQMLEALTAFLSENAPSFSGQRLKLLLDFLYDKELAAEGAPPRFTEAERDQLAAWSPASERPRSADRRRGTEHTVAELRPVADRRSSGSPLKLLAVGAITLALAAGAVVAWVLLSAPPPPPASDPSAVTPLELPGKRATRPPTVPTEVPPTPPPPPTTPVADDRHRVIKLVADTHTVTRRPARTQWKTLDDTQSWRVTLAQPGPVLANVVLELEDAGGGVQEVPIKNGETLEVKGKRSVGVRCDPGPRAAADETATLQLTPTNGRAARLLIDPKLCLEYEQAKGLELDHTQRLRLALPEAGDVALGDSVPLRVAYRARLKDGAFSAGSLSPGGEATIEGAVFLELGFLDQSIADNRGSTFATLDVADDKASASGSVERVGKPKAVVVMPYAESLAMPAVKRARDLMRTERFAEVLAVIEPCLKETRPVPECIRLEGEAFVKLDQRERGIASYRRFLELAPEDHPGRRSVQLFVDEETARSQ